MTPTERLQRVAKLCEELQEEDNDAIVQSRIEALAKELKVNKFQCGFLYWALKGRGEFTSMFGNDIRIRFRAR